MSDKTKKILAIIALVFVGIFTVAFVVFLVDPYMFGGVVAYITLVSGVVGIGLFFVIKAFSKKGGEAEETDEPETDGENEPVADDGATDNETVADDENKPETDGGQAETDAGGGGNST